MTRVSLGHGSDGMFVTRCNRRGTAGCDHQRPLPLAKAHPTRPHRPALGRALECPRGRPAGGRQPTGRVARWQRRYAEAGVEALLRDKTRPPGAPPHSTETVAEVLALTCSEPPGQVTHWTGRAVPRAVVISLRAVQSI